MNNRKILLNLGCGTVCPPDWVNIDSSWNAWVHKFPMLVRLLGFVFPSTKKMLTIEWNSSVKVMDLTRKLPYADNSVDGIYMSHVLEHIDKEKAEILLSECYRVLRRGGRIRIVVPDLLRYAQLYVKDKSSVAANLFLENLHIFATNKISLLGKIYFFFNNTDLHKWMYDSKTLRAVVRKTGFKIIKNKLLFDSKIDFIKKVELPERFVNAICVEATK